VSGKRLISLMVALIIGVSVLSACGGSDEPDKPTAKPTATQDPDGFTPEQREVADAVEAYNKAFFGRGSLPVEPAIQKFVTKRLLDQVGPAESKAVDKAGLQYIGTVKLIPKDVTIKGDKATFKGCQDGSKAFVVKKGEKSAGVGSRPVGTTQLTIGLVREDGTWLVDDPQGEAAETC
jgi:hypothetical protein